MKILTVDEDALFECSKECLNLFPRIQSVEDYLNVDALKVKWNEFYDKYEADFNLRLSKFLFPLYFSSAIKYAKRFERVDTHDEILKLFDLMHLFQDTELFLVNIDQHHDQSMLHTQGIDCSNWASPFVIFKEYPNLNRYFYKWFYTSVTEDFHYCGEFTGVSYSAKKYNISEFNKREGIFPVFDLVVFCKSRAYVPSNYWEFFDLYFDLVRGCVKNV